MSNLRRLKIGTRSSPLALEQARQVLSYCKSHDIKASLVTIDSTGDTNLVTPLYEMGIQGIFTKALDEALLNHTIDVAVHSLKDVPTLLAKGLQLVATLPRASHSDCIISKKKNLDYESSCTIATASLRRKAQWLSRYPHHEVVNIRGNINTRLQKLFTTNSLDGVIFAKAGLERLGLNTGYSQILDWMISAPAQGAIGVVVRSGCKQKDIWKKINNTPTAVCTSFERAVLRHLQAGCSLPVGVYATIKGKQLFAKAMVLSRDGSVTIQTNTTGFVTQASDLAKSTAEDLLRQGASKILSKI